MVSLDPSYACREGLRTGRALTFRSPGYLDCFDSARFCLERCTYLRGTESTQRDAFRPSLTATSCEELARIDLETAEIAYQLRSEKSGCAAALCLTGATADQL